MRLEMLKSKIHRARITHTDLDYEGSLTIDEDLMKEASILPFEKVHVVNVNNGARLETYAIPGAAGSGIIQLNGAAARSGQPGDLIIILTYAYWEADEVRNHSPKVVKVDEKNRLMSRVR